MGLIVNPIAGMGGRVGLKGTDGPERLAQAIELGARPSALRRVAIALEQMTAMRERCTVVAAGGPMGARLSASHGFDTESVPFPNGRQTSSADTRQAAAEIVNRGVDLLLFGGGDGTAREILAAVGTRVPVLGVPTGVKMHSGVFAATPRGAGDVASDFVVDPTAGVVRAEVVDREQDGEDPGPVRLYGEMLVPRHPTRVLSAKATGVSADASLHALQASLIDEMAPGRLYILGPGGSIGGIRRALGIAPRALAVAAVRDRELVADDLNETRLLGLIDESTEVTALVGVIGGQGSLLGRGNQQLSARVLWRIGLDNLVVVASLEKLAALDPPQLHVDTGDPDLDRALGGFRAVRVAPRRTVLFPVKS